LRIEQIENTVRNMTAAPPEASAPDPSHSSTQRRRPRSNLEEPDDAEDSDEEDSPKRRSEIDGSDYEDDEDGPFQQALDARDQEENAARDSNSDESDSEHIF
jgi:hypothetical protein